jgi:ubiquinone/menaquinone biosynthesis C-methylase UbiE
MTAPPSPLQAPEAWDNVAEAYAAEVAPVFEDYAREALRYAGVVPGMKVVDVAAGPGTLTFLAVQAGAAVSAIDFSPSMLAALRARAEGVAAVDATLGSGEALPYPDASFDAGFSMFGLMFFPDRAAGFRELARVLKPGAVAVVSSWVAMDRIPVMAAAMGIVGELMPGPKPPPRPMPLVDPETCIAEMSAGGFKDVVVHEFSSRVDAPTTAALVDSFARTNAPIVLAKKKLGAQWDGVAAALLTQLTERFGGGPHQIVMPANLIVGTRSGG